ncbi:unnamed protein product [Ranitomeya imitator]|uniref:von Willebrand factor A domain-containing protein 5B1 n=1 Tax=Ranitomeya imitator TaxID=111125 RepID=A0ABN9LHM0_9NEOB|nr:unnamed protein product [Ranitomeya imitator]
MVVVDDPSGSGCTVPKSIVLLERAAMPVHSARRACSHARVHSTRRACSHARVHSARRACSHARVHSACRACSDARVHSARRARSYARVHSACRAEGHARVLLLHRGGGGTEGHARVLLLHHDGGDTEAMPGSYCCIVVSVEEVQAGAAVVMVVAVGCPTALGMVVVLYWCPAVLRIEVAMQLYAAEVGIEVNRDSEGTGFLFLGVDPYLSSGCCRGLIKRALPIDYISVIKMHFGTNLPAGRFGGRTAHAPAILEDGGARGEDGRTPAGSESLEMACEFFQSNKMFGMSSNFSSLLSRILAYPVHRGYPRQLFIITDTGFTNSSRVLELLSHARSTRSTTFSRRYVDNSFAFPMTHNPETVFAFGLGANVHHKILERAAKLTRGTVELLSEGERLHPKLIKSLKKALEPVLSDITIDWYMPETMEALLTPNDIAPLYPGDSLISYCTLYNTASFRSKKGPTRVARGGSLSSVFQSQEESQTQGTTDTSYQNPSTGMEDVERALQEISQEISLEFSAWSEDPERTESIGGDGAQVSDIRKRIVRSSYVQEQYMLTHCSVSTEATQAPTQPSMCSDHTRATSHGSTSGESVGSRETVSGDCVMSYSRKVCNQGKKSISQNEGIGALNQSLSPSCKATVTQSTEELVRKKALIHATMSGRSFSSPHGELDMLRLRTVLEKVSQNLDSEDVNAKHTEGLCDSLNGQLPSPAQLDWDMLVDAQYLFSASPTVDTTNTGSGFSNESGWQCRAVIHGYIGSSNHSWETTISLETLLNSAGEDFGSDTESEKSYDLHHLAAHSVIQDNEELAWRESDIEHGSSRRFRLKAMQTSKSCSQASFFTCHMPIDPDTQDEFPGQTIVCRGKELVRNIVISKIHVLRDGKENPKTSVCWPWILGGRSRRSGSSNSGKWSVADNRHSECMEDTFENAGVSLIPPSSPPGIASESGLEKMGGHEGQIISPRISQKSSDTSLISRVGVGKRKIRSLSGKLSPLKPCLTGDKEPKSERIVQDYLPLISLQSPEGFFNLNGCFSGVVQISLQRLLRTSPFTCHHGSLSPVSEPCPLEHEDFIRGGTQTYKGGSQPQVPMTNDTASLPVYATSCPEALCHQADSGRGSETDPCDISPCPSENGNEVDPDLEGCSWATAVALAWLEHRCAGFFVEWELLAAKAEGWLRAQTLPDGLQLLALKGAARQLFLLLRHWDENLNLNMLCYKPGDV